MFPHLFSPFRIRALCLQNRIVMPAMGVFLVEADGSVTDRTLAYYRLRAKGGAGMVMVEASAVAPEGIVSAHQMRIYEDRHIPGLKRIASIIKDEGSKAAIQIHHAGRQTSHKVIGRAPLAPSPLRCPTIRGDVETLNKEGIERIISLFGDAAERALEAGFELIEIHGAHGYLINQFLSGFSNIREDEYGGDTQGRCRIAAEIVREVRRRVGPDVPISFKISAQEFVPGGLTVEESIEIVQALQTAGIDAVQVSAGNDATPEWISQPMLIPRACLVESASRIKDVVRIPVICVGRINGPALAEEILRDSKADLVCMGRALLADPELPIKAREGRTQEIRRCIACNTCINSIFKKGRVECLVNPEVSRERELAIRPVSRFKKVIVVGGGPAGSEAAWVAASRGHEVELFEAQDVLGGQIIVGSIPAYKRELLNIVGFHEHQLRRHGVRCHLGHRIDTETLLELGADVVILATGAKPRRPAFLEGSLSEGLLDYVTAYNGFASLPEKLVVVGGGSIGCELSLHLAREGHEVTIMEMQDAIGSGYEAMTRKLLVRAIVDQGIKLMTGCEISGYDGRQLFFNTNEGPGSLETSSVVIAAGAAPEDTLYRQLKDRPIAVHRIGDCLEPRSIKEAIYEGAVAGRSV